MSPEFTFDAQAGEAFESRNGSPVEAPAPSIELSNEPAAEEFIEDPQEDLIDQPEQEVQEAEYSPNQQAAIDRLGVMGLDVERGFDFLDSDQSPLSDGAYDRLASALGDEDPQVVELGALVAGFAERFQDSIVGDDVPFGGFTQEQEHQLADLIGGEHASDIVNLNFRLNSGEITIEDAFRFVAKKPSLRNAYVKAVKHGLLNIHL